MLPTMLMLRLLWMMMGVIVPGPGMRPKTGQPGQPTRMCRGLVVDSGHRPLAGASIMAKGTRLAANSEGRFELRLPAGTFELLVDYPGYLAPRTLAAPPDSVLTVMLYSTRPRAMRR